MAPGRALSKAVMVVWYLLILVTASCNRTIGAGYVRDHYTKTDVSITMRDGVKLFTVIYAPKDTSKTYPIILNRTPYSVPYGADNYPDVIGPNANFARSGYFVVYQDVRGKYMSEGDYVNVRPELKSETAKSAADRTAFDHAIDESTDAYDTIDWLVRNVANNNGRVGMWGISYPGFYAACGAIRSHPALKAVSPQAPVTDWFAGDDVHHNGAFFLMDNFAWDFESTFDLPRSGPSQTEVPSPYKFTSDNAYQFYLGLGPLKNVDTRYFHGTIPFWDELMEHGDYDSYWRDRNILNYVRDIKPAMLVVGGWFDAEDLYGPLHLSRELEVKSPRTPTTLVMGPWIHGGWSNGHGDRLGDITFGSATGDYFRDKIEFPFFERYLKNRGDWKEDRAKVYLAGSNEWRSYDSWPPKNGQLRSWYFGEGHRLLNTQSQSSSGAASDSFDSFVSDPTRPVPYCPFPGIDRDNRYMIADQRFLASRTDVCTYDGSTLEEDVTLAGPVMADLFVSTTGTDADWVVKIIDVYPDYALPSESAGGNIPMAGYQMLVRADVMRGKFRKSFSEPQPFVPGAVTEVKFNLPDIGYTFKKGHRIMVQVQSTWFPLVDLNPQTFCDIYRADLSAFQVQTEKIFFSAKYPSHITAETIPLDPSH